MAARGSRQDAKLAIHLELVRDVDVKAGVSARDDTASFEPDGKVHLGLAAVSTGSARCRIIRRYEIIADTYHGNPGTFEPAVGGVDEVSRERERDFDATGALNCLVSRLEC